MTNETGFFIERSTSPTGTFVRVATALASTKTSRGTGGRTYTDTGLTPGTTYYYRVVAVNTEGRLVRQRQAVRHPPSPPPPRRT